MIAMEATAAPFSSVISSRKNLSSSPSSSIRVSSPNSLFLSRKNPGKFKYPRSLSVRASSSSDSVVTLLDYGAGNVRSIRNALRHLGFTIKDVQTPGDILNADRLIFPGVGAFAPAMDVLNKTGMAEALCTYIENDRPFLGICLGLQLLFESSEENGPVKGLGLIPGIVGRFDSSAGIRVPHIGWNALQVGKDSEILDDVGNRHVYFVHSYRAIPSNENKEWISSTCNYGESFISSIRRGNVHAVQFHPEKSGEVGLSVLNRFLNPNLPATQKPMEGKASKLAKRVIACLDVRSNDKGDLVVTKGDQYDVREQSNENEVRNLGKPVDLAGQYYKDGADEISFLNITGFRDFPLGDLPMIQVLRHTSKNVFVPLTVGGGIRDFTDASGRYYSSLEVAAEYFRSGADKISIGSDAVYAAEEFVKSGVKTGKSSLEQISRVYGNQAVVVSIDPRRVYVNHPDDVPYKVIRVTNPGPNGEEYAWYQCTVSGGREGRPIGAYELAKAVEELGAGEILLNCIDCDGQGKGFDIDLVKLISDSVGIPVIASSGAGTPGHFSEVFEKTNASAALAAGIFHRKEVPIQAVKEHLQEEDIEVRI
ncbi:PREDICTED: imidazole glycerol phosphate synthase hisHF, chloroplastic-like isoform X2 [Camelina sativa]|uniref:Imidazole glycerol phosphate synthase hisHF n=1 Tax=Camelina sativa TaxID=90675 RepID=A0ABM0UYJ9_CAMSA|nr:PREDICTED: imidazole glycerol phosphate synthase hisHF, chloroplastic-like isoform X1 [Camelina sativa]XP_010448199.1 PREDICTED: imidazole glycerol phosphate synthase hisHF, chloroplastic-like isoform X2 [Camelina sativa]